MARILSRYKDSFHGRLSARYIDIPEPQYFEDYVIADVAVSLGFDPEAWVYSYRNRLIMYLEDVE